MVRLQLGLRLDTISRGKRAEKKAAVVLTIANELKMKPVPSFFPAMAAIAAKKEAAAARNRIVAKGLPNRSVLVAVIDMNSTNTKAAVSPIFFAMRRKPATFSG